MKNLKIVFLLLLISFLPDVSLLIISKIFNVTFDSNNSTLIGKSLIEVFVITVLLAPIIETLFFQTLFFKLFENISFFKNKKRIILLSSLIFGLSHFYSFTYILIAFFGGGVLSTLYYLIYKSSNSHKEATYYTFALHLLKNLITFMVFIF